MQRERAGRRETERQWQEKQKIKREEASFKRKKAENT